MVETIDSIKIAKLLDRSWSLRDASSDSPLKVLVQVNGTCQASESIKTGTATIASVYNNSVSWCLCVKTQFVYINILD